MYNWRGKLAQGVESQHISLGRWWWESRWLSKEVSLSFLPRLDSQWWYTCEHAHHLSSPPPTPLSFSLSLSLSHIHIHMLATVDNVNSVQRSFLRKYDLLYTCINTKCLLLSCVFRGWGAQGFPIPWGYTILRIHVVHVSLIPDIHTPPPSRKNQWLAVLHLHCNTLSSHTHTHRDCCVLLPSPHQRLGLANYLAPSNHRMITHLRYFQST